MDMKWKLVGVAGASVLATLAAGGVALATVGHPPMRFAAVDRNADGRVSRGEWLLAADTRFKALDTDHDGALAAGELPRHPHRGHGRHGGPRDDGEGRGTAR